MNLSEQKKYYYEDLDKLTKEELEKIVEEEQEKFDLDAFFHKRGVSSGGIVLITPNDFIMTDTFLKDKSMDNYGDHGYNVDALYKYLYNHKVTSEWLWQYSVLNDGNIVIQLCNDCASAVWLPLNITPFQLEKLEYFSERIKEIKENDEAFFEEHPIEFICSIDPTKNSYELDEIIELAKERLLESIDNDNMKMAM